MYEKTSKDSEEGYGTNVLLLANEDYYDIEDPEAWLTAFTDLLDFGYETITTGSLSRPKYRYDKLSASSVLLPNVHGAPIPMIKIYYYQEHEDEDD